MKSSHEDRDVRMEPITTNISSRHFEQAAIDKGLSVTRSRKSLIISDGKSQVKVSNSLIGKQSPLTKVFNKKGASKLLLKTLGANVLEGYLFNAEERGRALAYAESLGWPVVIKPDDENKGRSVYVNVEGEDAFLTYFDRVAERYGTAFVEKQCEFATEYRFYCAGGRVLAVTRRVPANVVGDGISSVASLVKAKNRLKKERRYPRIKLDDEVARVLDKQGLSMDSVPDKGRIVPLRSTSNISTGGDSVEVMETIHPSYIEAVEAVFARLPDTFIAGFDVFIREMHEPASDSNWFICEVNRRPAVRMHIFPWEGEPKNIGKEIMEMLF